MAFRIRARKSAIGSVRLIPSPSFPVRPPQDAKGTSGNVYFSDQHATGAPPPRVSSQQATARRPPVYQLYFTTPGISPFRASPRKQRRQTPNLRRYPRGRPQSLQRLCLRELNFGFRASLTRFAVVAINPLYAPWRNGMPKARSSARAELSSFAVVTIVMFMPF